MNNDLQRMWKEVVMP